MRSVDQLRAVAPDRRDAVVALALTQHGVVSLEQLRELGLAPSTVHKRAAAGRLHRLHQGVYAVVPPPLLGEDARRLAAVLACGPGALLSHLSAARVQGIIGGRAGPLIDITLPVRSSRRRAGIRVHRSTTLAPADAARVKGIPCTAVPRTLLDIAPLIGRRALERACDEADFLDVLDLPATTAQLARHPRHPGTGRLRAVLEEHYIGATPTWNEFEDAFLEVSREAGLPPPQINHLIDLHDGEPRIRIDFAWPELRLAVETDGHRRHRTRQRFESDRRRDQRLTIAGWRPVRVTWRQLHLRRDEVRRTLIALARGA